MKNKLNNKSSILTKENKELYDNIRILCSLSFTGIINQNLKMKLNSPGLYRIFNKF